MKKKILTTMILCLSILMIGCNQNKNLENMSHITTKDYTGIKKYIFHFVQLIMTKGVNKLEL